MTVVLGSSDAMSAAAASSLDELVVDIQTLGVDGGHYTNL
jgi:hypothetical protein